MSEYKIADGWDNAAGLTALEALDPPLFAGYADGVLSEWHDAEAMAGQGIGGGWRWVGRGRRGDSSGCRARNGVFAGELRGTGDDQDARQRGGCVRGFQRDAGAT